MTSEGLGEMFEGDYADTCGGKFLLMLMGGRAEGLTCADPGGRTPIGLSGNFNISRLQQQCINVSTSLFSMTFDTISLKFLSLNLALASSLIQYVTSLNALVFILILQGSAQAPASAGLPSYRVA